MPELPEVQTIVSELEEQIIGRHVQDITEFYQGTVRNSGAFEVNSRLVTAVKRRGKYIMIELESGDVVVVHLRMTGKLIYDTKNLEVLLHERARITFTDSSFLRFDDVRTFGKIDYVSSANLISYFSKMGIEPLSEEFNYDYFKTLLHKSNRNIKTFLLDQSKIAGLGNIYVCEALYRSNINPYKRTNELNDAEINQLLHQIKDVLTHAIECNGTTISDYRRVDDKTGTFQNYLQIYGKKLCPKQHEVSRDKIGGRSTFYCPICQPKFSHR